MALPLLPSAIAAAKLAARSPAVRAGAKRGFKKAVSGDKAAKKATPSTVGRWRPGKTGPNWRERKWASNRRTRSGPPGTKGGK